MSEVFVLIRETGAYSDHNEDIVGVFSTKDLAMRQASLDLEERADKVYFLAYGGLVRNDQDPVYYKWAEDEWRAEDWDNCLHRRFGTKHWYGSDEFKIKPCVLDMPCKEAE